MIASNVNKQRYVFTVININNRYRLEQQTGIGIQKMLRRWYKNLKVFMPISKYMIAWYSVVIWSMIANYYFAILYICFSSDISHDLITYFCQPILLIVCILDILISLNTSFIKNGQLIVDKKIIKIKYITSIFAILDIVSLIGVMTQIIIRSIFSQQLPIVHFLIFIKIFKIYQFDLLIEKYVIRSKKWLLLYQIVKHLLLLILLCHLIGSFFFLLDVKLIQWQWYPKKQLWVYSSYAYENIIQQPQVWKYTYSFYFAIITLSGVAYGDLTPLNPTQVIYTCFVFLLPMIVYAYLFTKIEAYEQTRELKIKKYIKVLKNYFLQSQIEQKSSTKFLHYLIYVYQIKYQVKSQYFNQIAPKLKQKFISHVLNKQFDFNIFAILDTPHSKLEDIKNIVYQAAQEQTFPSKFMFKMEKNKQKKLYFILSGKVFDYIKIGQYKHAKSLKNKAFFGQYTFFTGISHKHLNHLFQTSKFTICQTIDYTKFRQKLGKNLPILQQFFNVRNRLIFQKELKQLRIHCIFCQSQKHIVEQCPRLCLSVNILSLLDKKNQRNNSFKRRKQINEKTFYLAIQQIPIVPLIQKQDQVKNYEQKNIQTDEQNLPIFLFSKWRYIEIVENWKYFYPQYSLP